MTGRDKMKIISLWLCFVWAAAVFMAYGLILFGGHLPKILYFLE